MPHVGLILKVINDSERQTLLLHEKDFLTFANALKISGWETPYSPSPRHRALQNTTWLL